MGPRRAYGIVRPCFCHQVVTVSVGRAESKWCRMVPSCRGRCGLAMYPTPGLCELQTGGEPLEGPLGAGLSLSSQGGGKGGLSRRKLGRVYVLRSDSSVSPSPPAPPPSVAPGASSSEICLQP